MAATLTTLRIGETVTVRGTPVNTDGTNAPVLLQNVGWGGNDINIINVSQDSGDDYLAYVTGLASGPTAVHMFSEDAFTIHDDEADVVVLNASRFKFLVGSLLFEPSPDFASIVGLTVEAHGWDVREDDPGHIYPYGPGSPPTGIYDVLWTSQNGAVLFGGQTAGSPAGTATLADTLKAEIFPDINGGEDEESTDVVTITAKNNAGVTITGTLNVTIRRVASVSIAITTD